MCVCVCVQDTHYGDQNFDVDEAFSQLMRDITSEQQQQQQQKLEAEMQRETVIAQKSQQINVLETQLQQAQQQLQQALQQLQQPQQIAADHPGFVSTAHAPIRDLHMSDSALAEQFERLRDMPAGQAEVELWQMTNTYTKSDGEVARENSREGMFLMKSFAIITNTRPNIDQWYAMSRLCGRGCESCVARGKEGRVRMGGRFCNQCELKGDVRHIMLP